MQSVPTFSDILYTAGQLTDCAACLPPLSARAPRVRRTADGGLPLALRRQVRASLQAAHDVLTDALARYTANAPHPEQVHFYEDDAAFERLWNSPHKYLPILKQYNGVISPDFSLYRDMPLVMQQWNVYRGRAIAHWLQENGVPVIPNIRFGDERTYSTVCLGIPKYSTISVGSHGCIKIKREREFFKEGLDYIVNELAPKAIVVYGAAPDCIFGKYQANGIEILQFDSEFMQSRKAVTA